jgi:epoxyqueuosine reductase
MFSRFASRNFAIRARYHNFMDSIETQVKCKAREIGFELVGIAAAGPADSFDQMRDWLDEGYAGEMHYMYRQVDARRDPNSILPNVRSVVMVGMNYHVASADCSAYKEKADAASPPARCIKGRISRYAWGQDYHAIIRDRLSRLLEWIQQAAPGCCGRGVVDTAPLLERDFARRAGLGWFGKNTMLLNKRLGSYFFLGALLLDLKLHPDPAHETSHCGTCTACLQACPTRAFVEPGVMDARRCISYLTIELRGPIPTEFREPMNNWVFGCDICQEVCPWNRKAPETPEAAFHPRADLEPIDLVELLGFSEEDFRQRFRGTTLTRAKRKGLLRNAAIALGNQGNPAALPALRRALEDSEPLVQEAAEWAIARILREDQNGTS